MFLKRHFEKKIKNPTQYATGVDLGRLYPEGEDDWTSLGGPPRHLKFGKNLLRIGGGGGVIVQSKGCSGNLFSLDTAVVALE